MINAFYNVCIIHKLLFYPRPTGVSRAGVELRDQRVANIRKIGSDNTTVIPS